MFTGFESENIPAIKVWDTSNAEPAGTVSIISLADDCAPLQFIKGGQTQVGFSTCTVYLYLPPTPVEGKRIKIMFHRYNGNPYYGGYCYIYSSEKIGGTNSHIYRLGYGQTLDLVWSSQFLDVQPGGSPYAPLFRTGWISENQGPLNSGNFNSLALGYNVTAPYSSTITIGNNCSNYGGVVIGTNCLGVAGGVAISGNVNGSGGVAISGTTGGGSALAILATANGNNSVALGGSSNTSPSPNSTVVGGASNNANGTSSSVFGGGNNIASGSFSSVWGSNYGTARSITGLVVFTASNTPLAATSGITQTSLLVLGAQTGSALATVMRSDSGVATTTNQLILPNNSAYYVKGSIIANVTGGGNTKSWDFIATIKRGANAAATSIVGSVTLNVQAADAGASTWIVAITADTTNGGLAVTVTGQAATTIRWVAKLESTEVTY